jgi:subtilisin-like proprotein convertase family protein
MKKFTKFLLVVFLLLLFSNFGNAQQNNQQITSVVGKLIRVTPKLADIDPATMYGQPLKITRDMNGIIGMSEEGEEKLERRLRNKAKHFVDPLIQGQGTNTISPNTPISAINQNFDGQTWAGFDPSDNNLAVGPNHVIQMINDQAGSKLKIWNKSGGVVQNPITMASISGLVGLGDPVVVYDQLADRWVLTEFGPGGATQNYLVMAVSVTNDPTGAYKIYQYTDNTFFPDYPKYSVWHNAYFARSSDFNTAGTAYLGASIYAFDRNAMLAGAATATMVRVRMLDAGSLSYYSMNTIGLDGTTPSSQGGLFAVPNQANSTINLFEFTPNFANPTASVVGALVPISVAPYNIPPFTVAQKGTTGQIETLGQRLMYRLSYRNHGGVESILVGHTVQGATTALSAVRWYEFRRTAGNWGLYQQGTIAGADGNSRLMPGIAMDALGNIGLMYNVAGSTAFPSIVYTGRNECDPLGQMTLPEQVIINGTNAHTLSTRWGDYNTLAADPTIAGSFWSTAEYGAAPNGNGTRIANFTVLGGVATFTSQPTNTTVCAGTTASFSATAAGNPPITYQWQVSTDNGVTWTDIAGATASTYSFTAAAADNGKKFRCTAQSSCGPGISNSATLTITTLSQGGSISPATSVACAGVNSTTLTLTGSIGNIIRWESSINGGTTWTNIANTTTTLTATNLTQTTQYRVLVQSSGCTSSYSAVGTINFVTPGIGALTITANQGTTLCAGDPTLLTAMGLTTTTFSNTGAITIPTSGVAAPYPSNIAVSGLPTTGVTVKSVSLNNINHTWASDISILLQSPTGQNVILMSSAAGGTAITSRNYTFDDAAAAGLTSAAPSGTYKPTNNSTTRNWPAPGPGVVVQGTNPLLSSFTGDPNGTWKLYVFDAATPDAGNINGGYSITFASTGIIPGLTYTWSPSAGLNATTGNPVAASPAVSTTYTVNATSAAGCTSSASIAITVNARPSITTQPLPVTACENTTATFTANGAGAGAVLQWQESTNGGTTYTNITNGGKYAGATTGTLTITGVTAAMNNNLYRLSVSGTCTPVATSNGAKLTVNPAPPVVVTPATGCGGIAGTNGTLLTASGASSYTWSPVAGLYTNATATTAYTGTNTASVYAAPTTYTTYIVTGTNAATGCINTATASINYTPTAPIINPSPANLCFADSIIMLTKAQPKTLSFTSGTINVPIIDNNVTGGKNSINVSGIPAGAFITGVVVKMNATHTWAGDLVVALKAPNNQILNLDYCLSQTNNGTGVLSAAFANTQVSSNGLATLGSGIQPYTSIFKADASTTASFFGAPTGPTGFDATTGLWNDLYSTPNGSWTLAWADVFPGADIGTFSDWSIDITYQVGSPSTAPVWSPVTGLFTNAAATVPYVAGTARDTVWAKIPKSPLPGSYNYQVTANSLPSSATATTNFVDNNGFGLVTFNVKNNNTFDVKLTDISSVVFFTDAHNVAAFYKPSPINGAPGAINSANGWTQFGSGSITGTGFVQPFMSNLSLIIPAGATYGIAVQADEVGFGADIDYSTLTAGTYTFTTGGCSIITGSNIGYGGDLAPAAPINTPRGFIGNVTFANLNAPCTSPSRTITVTINDSVKIVSQPVNASACMDKTASFTVSATGTGLTYQWQVRTPTSLTFSNVSNGGVYSGANQATLVITAPPASMNGYQYQCVISGISPCGGKTTTIAVLTVNPFPVVTVDASLYHKLLPGLRTTVFSTVGTPGGTYVWLRNGAVVPGATGNSLVANIDQLGDYSLKYTDPNGCTSTSNVVSLTDSASGRVFIYPTPNAGQFQVRYYSIIYNTNLPRGINVYDARGKRVLTQTYSIGAPYARMDVDLRKHGSGVYWIEVVDVVGNRLAMGRTEVVR